MSNSQAIVSGNLRAELARRELSQTDLGRALGLPQSAISKRLRSVTPWTLPELEEAARFLNLSLEQLVTAPSEPTAIGA